MSEDETPVERPRIDAAQLRERAARLRAEAEAAWAEQERCETASTLAAISEIAQRQVEVFRELPCRGEVARLSECGEETAASCIRRQTPSCPRNIVARDAALEADALQARLEMSGIPRGVRAVLGGAFEATEATQVVDEWLAGTKRLLLLSGGVGTGKSVAAGYAIKRSPGRWMHASEIAKAARFENDDRMRELKGARLLVVDDLGSEFNDASGWGRAHLTTLLLERYEDNLRTIITTNMDGKQWGAYADQRIRDRLVGDGTARVIGGKSKRRA